MMRIIGDGFFDISKGHTKLIEFENKFARAWGGTIKSIKEVKEMDRIIKYEELMYAWEEENQLNQWRWQDKIARNKRILIAVGILFVVGLISLPISFGLLVYLANIVSSSTSPEIVGASTFFIKSLVWTGVVIFGFLCASPFVLFGMYVQLKSIIKRGPDKNPTQPDIGREFSISTWLDLESEWWSRLRLSSRSIPQNFGSEGERLLLQSLLLNNIPDHFYYIPNLLLRENLDADAVLVGPTGIWVLESKYISGTIRLRNGVWSREKGFFESRGIHKTKNDVFDDFEAQWLREKRIIEKTIKKHLPDIASLDAAQIKGGLVFTHNKCSLDVDSSAKVGYGIIEYWLGEINSSIRNNAQDNVPVLSPDQVVEVVDVLLNHSKSIDSMDTMSAVYVALEVYGYQVDIATDLYEMHSHLIDIDELPVEISEEALAGLDPIAQLKSDVCKLFETG